MIVGCTSDAGKSFLVAALCRCFANRGVRVAPFERGAAGKIIIGSFSKPRAFSGDINLNRDAVSEIENALSGGGTTLMAAFGSPFVFDGFHRRLAAGLCAFCGLEDFQRTAAAVLTGAASASGVMPVDLKLEQASAAKFNS